MAIISKTQEVIWKHPRDVKYHCKDEKYRTMPTNHIMWELKIIPMELYDGEETEGHKADDQGNDKADRIEPDTRE